MGPDMLKVLDPPHDDLGFPKTVIQLLIKKALSKGAVKAFSKAIFPGPT
jgi:hypothetical protein